jgi:Uncharacterized conserved protein
MCHAPIVVPGVAGPGEAARCQSTTGAMREVAARAVATNPDRLVVISPHSPRRRREWGAWSGRHIGDLSRFGAPRVRVDLPDAPEVAEALDLPVIPHPEHPFDHGAVVPLAFLWAAGWRGPTAILALPWEDPDSEAVGRALAALPGRTAVIASGDMSHRLLPGAPSGYHPVAASFDRSFVQVLEAGEWARVRHLPNRDLAAEDVVDSTRVALAAAGRPLHAEVLSYEGPWGVGYTEAVFLDPAPPLYVVARQAIGAHLAGAPFSPPDGGPASAGVFVTLHRDGRLRGCIGHIEPVHDRLYAEIADVAVAAATGDPRFAPLSARELEDVDLEVSVLEPPEPIDGLDELDPRVYGVVVSNGRRRGLLLPDVDGVETAEDQVAIARRKAGIGSREPVRLERFRVRKVARP